MFTIYEKAVQKFGTVAQKQKAVEELTELSLVLQHNLQNKCDNEAVITEIADCYIMLDQLRVMYGSEAIDNEIAVKLTRLNKLL
jgi:hypothetical protein